MQSICVNFLVLSEFKSKRIYLKKALPFVTAKIKSYQRKKNMNQLKLKFPIVSISFRSVNLASTLNSLCVSSQFSTNSLV